MNKQTLSDIVGTGFERGTCSIHNDDIPDLQDEIGRMTEVMIREQWSEFTSFQRKRFIWVVFKVMDSDTAVSILHITHGADVRNREFDALAAERAEVCQLRGEVEAKRLADEEYIAALEAKVEKLEADKAEMQQIIEDNAGMIAEQRNYVDRVDAQLYEGRKLREALAVVGEALKIANV